MIFADKIIMLRKKNGWSQEQFAEELGVSRQTISKWEGAQSVPDFNRVIQISELFGVSTDYLLKDNMELPEPAPPSQDSTSDHMQTEYKVSMEEANRFLEVRDTAAAKISIGVLLCILSSIPLFVLTELQESRNISCTEDQASGIGLFFLLIFVACAVILFIIEGLKLKPYEYMENVPIETAYGVDGMVKNRKEQYKPLHTKLLSCGVALCILSPSPLFLSEMIGEDPLAETVALVMLLLIVAIGVMMIVRCSIVWGSFHMLLETDDYTRRNKQERKRNKNISAVYWGIMTAIYLAYSFFTFNWEISWIIWPVAGVFYGVLCAILRIMRKEL